MVLRSVFRHVFPETAKARASTRTRGLVVGKSSRDQFKMFSPPPPIDAGAAAVTSPNFSRF